MEKKKRIRILIIVCLIVGWIGGYIGYNYKCLLPITKIILLLFAFLLVSWEPSFPMELLERKMKKGEDNSKKDGAYIGWTERSLIFCAVWIMNVVEGVSIGNVFNFLSIIIAGKSIYRFPSRNNSENSKTTRQWYISGTFASMTGGIFLSCLLIPEAPLFFLLFN